MMRQETPDSTPKFALLLAEKSFHCNATRCNIPSTLMFAVPLAFTLSLAYIHGTDSDFDVFSWIQFDMSVIVECLCCAYVCVFRCVKRDLHELVQRLGNKAQEIKSSSETVHPFFKKQFMARRVKTLDKRMRLRGGDFRRILWPNTGFNRKSTPHKGILFASPEVMYRPRSDSLLYFLY